MKKEVLRRITIGWGKYWQLKNILKNDKVSDNRQPQKQVLRIMCVYPSLLHGFQTWALTKKL